MPRYPHYLSPVGPGRWPGRVICLDCTSVSAAPATGSRVETSSLTGWSAVALTGGEAGYGVSRVASGSEASGLWSVVAYALDYPGPVWIVSYECARVWALLQLWEEIEHGRLLFSHSDPRAERPSDSGPVRAVRRADPVAVRGECDTPVLALRPGAAYLVIEDPPCILCAVMPGRVGRLIWVDVRNYGCAPPTGCRRGADTARWLAAWWMDCHKYLTAYGLAALQTTAASTSLRSWRHGYYDQGVLAHNDGPGLEVEAAGYYGGRCECHWLGLAPEQLYQLDIRAAYPWSCLSAPLPVRLRGVQSCERRSSDLLTSVASHCIAKVDIDTDEPAYPVRRHDDIIYPVGQYTTTLCGPELADALHMGRVKRCHRIALYDLEPCLRSYQSALYRLRVQARADGLPHLERLAKSLAVSVIGKLGARDKRWVDAQWWTAPVPYCVAPGVDLDGSPTRYRSVGWQCQVERDYGYHADAVPSIAAWVCSLCRVRLLSLIRRAGWEHVYYCDTDSLWVDDAGLTALLPEMDSLVGRPGALELRAGPCEVEIRGVKYYVADRRVTCAGMPRGQCEDAGDGQHYWYHDTPADALWHARQPSARRVLRAYVREPGYRGGVVTSSGRVEPIRMG